MSPGSHGWPERSSGSTWGAVSRWARPPQSLQVKTGCGSRTTPFWAASVTTRVTDPAQIARWHGSRPDREMIRTMPDNRQILIKSLPSGALAVDDYELVTTPAPDPGDG